MKKRIGGWSRIFLATALMTIGGVSAARADERIVAKVPFSFIVGGVRLPAGDYTVTENMFNGGRVLDRERRRPPSRIRADERLVDRARTGKGGARVREVRQPVLPGSSRSTGR